MARQISLKSLFVAVTLLATLFGLWGTFYPFGPLLSWFAAALLVAWWSIQRSDLRIGAVCGVMLLAGLLPIPMILVDGHVVPPRRLERITVGMTADNVRASLGNPTSVDASIDELAEIWNYSGLTWCQVRVSFDRNALVIRVDHDH